MKERRRLDAYETQIVVYTATADVVFCLNVVVSRRKKVTAIRALMPSLARHNIPCIRLQRLLQDGRRASPDNETRRTDSITTSVHNTIFKFV